MYAENHHDHWPHVEYDRALGNKRLEFRITRQLVTLDVCCGQNFSLSKKLVFENRGGGGKISFVKYSCRRMWIWSNLPVSPKKYCTGTKKKAINDKNLTTSTPEFRRGVRLKIMIVKLFVCCLNTSIAENKRSAVFFFSYFSKNTRQWTTNVNFLRKRFLIFEHKGTELVQRETLLSEGDKDTRYKMPLSTRPIKHKNSVVFGS